MDINKAIFDQIFGATPTQQPVSQPQPVHSVTQVSAPPQKQELPGLNFNIFSQPNVTAPIPVEKEEDIFNIGEEPVDDETYMPGETEPNNTFTFDGIPGFDIPQKPQTTAAQTSVLDLFGGNISGGENIIPPTRNTSTQSPYEGKPGRHPDNCECTKHAGTARQLTPESLAGSMPFGLENPMVQSKSFTPSEISSPQANTQATKVVLEFDANKILEIGRGLQTIGRAIEAIALSRLQ